MARTRRRFRLLPITMTMLSLLFVIKLNELYLDSQHLREVYGVREAAAEDKKDDSKKDDAKPAEDAKKDDAKPDDKKDEKSAKPVKEETTFGTGKSTVKEIEALKNKNTQPQFTQTEIDLLQNLSKRRDELDDREKELELKSKVLEATEKRITDKIIEMKTMQDDLSKVVAQYNEKQDTQIKSLVKIYENMKPDEAAAIFNELDMPILLEVIAKMSERKVAPVLANMSPKKAKDVTQELAERRKKSALSPNGTQPLAAAPLSPPTQTGITPNAPAPMSPTIPSPTAPPGQGLSSANAPLAPTASDKPLPGELPGAGTTDAKAAATMDAKTAAAAIAKATDAKPADKKTDEKK